MPEVTVRLTEPVEMDDDGLVTFEDREVTADLAQVPSVGEYVFVAGETDRSVKVTKVTTWGDDVVVDTLPEGFDMEFKGMGR